MDRSYIVNNMKNTENVHLHIAVSKVDVNWKNTKWVIKTPGI